VFDVSGNPMTPEEKIRIQQELQKVLPNLTVRYSI